jgi:transcriptional regulator with XRE-family HTH domain
MATTKAANGETPMAKKKQTPPTLTEVVRETIRARSLTAYRVGKTIGTTPPVIQRFLNGERDLRGATLDKLAAALGLALAPTEDGHPDLKGGTDGRDSETR